MLHLTSTCKLGELVPVTLIMNITAPQITITFEAASWVVFDETMAQIDFGIDNRHLQEGF